MVSRVNFITTSTTLYLLYEIIKLSSVIDFHNTDNVDFYCSGNIISFSFSCVSCYIQHSSYLQDSDG